jgi:hypothetical protein
LIEVFDASGYTKLALDFLNSGLIPAEESGSDKSRLGRIGKRGNDPLRRHTWGNRLNRTVAGGSFTETQLIRFCEAAP